MSEHVPPGDAEPPDSHPNGVLPVHEPVDAVDNQPLDGDGCDPHHASGASGESQIVDETGVPLRGVDLARRALEQARAAAKARGLAVGRGRAAPDRAPGARRGSANRRRWSGPGADDRDPQTLGRLTGQLVRARGWSEEVAAGAVLGRWTSLVGSDIAAHAQPVTLREGELLVRAESTAWATQLRMMQRKLLATIATGVGVGVVTRITIVGPAAPSWRKGERHVRGRGPRDTYG